MMHYIVAAPNGRITQSGSTSRTTDAKSLLDFMPGIILVEHSVNDLAGVYWNGSAVVAMPPRPSAAHDFDYTTKQWVANTDKAWAAARADRTRRLAATDWTQLGDVNDAAWLTYRQALRDITQQSDPFNIVWPTVPA